MNCFCNSTNVYSKALILVKTVRATELKQNNCDRCYVDCYQQPYAVFFKALRSTLVMEDISRATIYSGGEFVLNCIAI